MSTTAEPMEVHKLVDTIIPRETAQRAWELYGRYLLSDGDEVYALQQAALQIAEELRWHRHVRAGVKG